MTSHSWLLEQQTSYNSDSPFRFTSRTPKRADCGHSGFGTDLRGRVIQHRSLPAESESASLHNTTASFGLDSRLFAGGPGSDWVTDAWFGSEP